MANEIKDLGKLKETGYIMPVLFIGHGSPMNGIEENEFTQGWKKSIQNVPKPTAIIVISAHWETNGTKVTAQANPRMIHDFYGFRRRFSIFITKRREKPSWRKKLPKI